MHQLTQIAVGAALAAIFTALLNEYGDFPQSLRRSFDIRPCCGHA